MAGQDRIIDYLTFLSQEALRFEGVWIWVSLGVMEHRPTVCLSISTSTLLNSTSPLDWPCIGNDIWTYHSGINISLQSYGDNGTFRYKVSIVHIVFRGGTGRTLNINPQLTLGISIFLFLKKRILVRTHWRWQSPSHEFLTKRLNIWHFFSVIVIRKSFTSNNRIYFSLRSFLHLGISG